jgi:hypothetical protein
MSDYFEDGREFLEHYGVLGMKWGVRKERVAADPSFRGKPYSSKEGNGHGSKKFELTKQADLVVDRQKGFADVRPKDGFKNSKVKRNHDEMVASLEMLREEYPAIRDLKVEVVPMSHSPEFKPFYSRGSAAAAASGKPGEIRIAYHDTQKELTGRQQKYMKRLMPGMVNAGYAGNHEMGHVLAMTNQKTYPPAWDASHAGVRGKLSYVRTRDSNHRGKLNEHDLSFKELSKLSPYASSMPEEALAELAGNYFTPILRRQMAPDLERKATSLFDDLGGKRKS